MNRKLSNSRQWLIDHIPARTKKGWPMDDLEGFIRALPIKTVNGIIRLHTNDPDAVQEILCEPEFIEQKFKEFGSFSFEDGFVDRKKAKGDES